MLSGAEKKRRKEMEARSLQKQAELESREKAAIEEAKRLLDGPNSGPVVFSKIYDLPLISAAERATSWQWKQKNLVLDENSDGAYFLLENSKGELRRAPAPGF